MRLSAWRKDTLRVVLGRHVFDRMGRALVDGRHSGQNPHEPRLLLQDPGLALESDGECHRSLVFPELELQIVP